MEFAAQFWKTLLDNVVLLLILLPLVGASLVVLSLRFGVENVRRTALTNVLLSFALSLLMVGHYDPAQKHPQTGVPRLIQMVSVFGWLGGENHTDTARIANDVVDVSRSGNRSAGGWLGGRPDIQFAVGVDGISLWPIALTALLMIPAVVAGQAVDEKHPAAFYALLLVAQSTSIGLFAALDAVLFCVFLQFSIVPSFYLIGHWGGYNRRRVVGKFFLYNLAGALLVMLALLAVGVAHTSVVTLTNPSELRPPFMFFIPQMTEIISQVAQADQADGSWRLIGPWVFAALVMGFALHVAVAPFHTWLAATNVEVPTSVSLLLCGPVLLTGGYGLLRFVVPLFPELCSRWSPVLQLTAIAGVLYTGLLALAQSDLKKLVTYAGLCHFGLGVAGILSLNSPGVAGGLLHLIGQGVSLASVLFLIGVLETRHRTRERSAFSGLATLWPRFTLCFLFAASALIGVPGLNGFATTTMTLSGVFMSNRFAAVGGMLGCLLVLGAFVWSIQRVFSGSFRAPSQGDLRSVGKRAWSNQQLAFPVREPQVPVGSGLLTVRDFVALSPMAAVIVWMGLFPQFFIRPVQPSVARNLRLYSALTADEGGRATAKDDWRQVECRPSFRPQY